MNHAGTIMLSPSVVLYSGVSPPNVIDPLIRIPLTQSKACTITHSFQAPYPISWFNDAGYLNLPEHAEGFKVFGLYMQSDLCRLVMCPHSNRKPISTVI